MALWLDLFVVVGCVLVFVVFVVLGFYDCYVVSFDDVLGVTGSGMFFCCLCCVFSYAVLPPNRMRSQWATLGM